MSIHDETEAEEVRYVLGMDPGGTTGIAMLRYTENTAPELIYLHQITDGHRGFFDFFRGTQGADAVTPVSEKWKEGGIKGSNHEPLIVEGVQYTLWEDTLVYQGAEMKKLVPDSWLREQNLWTPGKRHQMDALIHALVFLRNSGHKPTIEALSNRTEKKLAEEGEAANKQLPNQQEKQPTPEDAERAAEMLKALQDAMKEVEQAAQDAAEAMQEAMSGAGEGEQPDGDGEGVGEASGDAQGGDASDGEATGPGTGGGDGLKEGTRLPEPQGKRKSRSLNGVFTGYDVADEEQSGKVLWDEKF